MFQALFATVLVTAVRWLSAAPTTAIIDPSATELAQRALPKANCTVHLDRADHAVLSTEVTSIVRSLAGQNPWLGQMLEAPEPPYVRGEQREVVGVEVPRPVDATFGRQKDTSVPGTEDIHAELKKVLEESAAAMATTEAVALRRQQRTSAADLGLTVSDSLDDVESVPLRIQFLNRLAADVADRGLEVHVAIVATVGADLRGVRKELLPWMQYHTELGVSKFYVRTGDGC